MTHCQRARRLRQIHARRHAIDLEIRSLDTEARGLENEHSWALGFKVPLRGRRLIDEMDRLDGDRKVVGL
jgi:hypothetical protein